MPEEQQQLAKLFRTTEELDHEEEAHVNGEIPDYVSGTYIRVGPGKFDLQDGFRMEHWLDGFSILSRFVIDGDRVQFNKKFLQSEAYKRALHAGVPVFCEYGSPAHPDPQKGFFSKLATRFLPFDLTDNDTLSLFQLGKELFASSETSYFRQVDPCNLCSGDRYDTNKYFGLNVCSAHPMTDPDTGITYQLGSTLLTGCKYHFVKIPPLASNQSAKDLLKKSKTLCTIPSSFYGGLSFNHSFGMTKNYLIFIEQPYVMQVTKAISSVVKGGQSFADWLEWKPEYKNRFFLIEKESGRVIKTEIFAQDPFFFLHFINCYEENGQVIVDVNGYPSTQVLQSMYLDRLRNGIFDVEDQPVALRFALPVLESLRGIEENVNLVEIKTEATAVRIGSQIVLTGEALSSGFELPMINHKFTGRKYSYVYATGSVAPGCFQNAIAKVDVRKKEAIVWKPSTSYFPGEPMFVPNPNSAGAEDDGVLISCVSDTTNSDSKDFILFLDARTMAELGRAKFRAHIPQALHGIFLNSS